MKFLCGSDHAGYPLKAHLVAFLRSEGHEVEDLGAHNTESVDYPDFGHAVAERVGDGHGEGEVTFGLLVCGTGQGIAMSANRHAGVRAALCTSEFTASMARRHNDANVLCLGARVVGTGLAESIVRAFIGASFEGGRHARRVAKIER